MEIYFEGAVAFEAALPTVHSPQQYMQKVWNRNNLMLTGYAENRCIHAKACLKKSLVSKRVEKIVNYLNIK